ncbi:hypothetical protein [Streptomyces collinus]|uniref:hypothetical protein n=1 Tax=Streptomyces collinus TaxID=42684 RepID=UPI0036CC3537
MSDGHSLEFLDIGALAQELGRARRRWWRLAGAVAAAGAEPGEVFALARAVVCGWWEQEEFWEREAVWGWRLEQVVAATRRWAGDPVGWEAAQWRLAVRDAVVFPEVVAVAQALVDPQVRHLAVDSGPHGLVRSRHDGERLAAVLGRRLGRGWLGELPGIAGAGPLGAWAQAVRRERRRPADASPLRSRLWRVHSVHRPVEVGAGLRLLAGGQGGSPGAGDSAGAGFGGEDRAGGAGADFDGGPVRRGWQG